jgi:hypothetical protein
VKWVVIVLCLGAFGVATAVKTGHFYAYTETQDANGVTHVNCYSGCDTVDEIAPSGRSAVLDDAVALSQASRSAPWARAARRMSTLLLRAEAMPRRPGAALVWQRAPALAQALQRAESQLAADVKVVAVATAGGETCRRAAVRVISRYAWATDRFQAALARRHPDWRAVRDFNAAMAASETAYAADLRPCIGAAPAEEQELVARAMGAA